MNDEQADDIRRWKADLTRGRRVWQFLESSFWKVDLEPRLLKRMSLDDADGLPRGALWSPSSKYGIELTALGSAFNGGRMRELQVLFNELYEWADKGREAEKRLKEKEIEV